jgi:hypothetical protein
MKSTEEYFGEIFPMQNVDSTTNMFDASLRDAIDRVRSLGKYCESNGIVMAQYCLGMAELELSNKLKLHSNLRMRLEAIEKASSVDCCDRNVTVGARPSISCAT